MAEYRLDDLCLEQRRTVLTGFIGNRKTRVQLSRQIDGDLGMEENKLMIEMFNEIRKIGI